MVIPLIDKMQSVSNKISDSTTLIFTRENNLNGLNKSCNKYATVMYGVIITHTAVKSVAAGIVIQLFIHLNQADIFLKINFSLYVSMIRYRQINLRQKLKIRGINFTVSLIEETSLFQTFCFQLITIKQVTLKLKVYKKEVTQYLHKEFLIPDFKNKDTQQLQQEEAYKEHVLLYH
jgi:hypothetical protein